MPTRSRPSACGSIRSRIELRAGVVQDSLADVQFITTLLGLVLVIWIAVPAVGALFLGRWLRRELAPGAA